MLPCPALPSRSSPSSSPGLEGQPAGFLLGKFPIRRRLGGERELGRVCLAAWLVACFDAYMLMCLGAECFGASVLMVQLGW